MPERGRRDVGCDNHPRRQVQGDGLCLSLERLRDYRAYTYRTAPDRRVTTLEGAVRFVEERGFVFFHPVQGPPMPSLWHAVAGDRPVPAEHDDPGHVTWGWKDSLLGTRRWYYAKVLRRCSTIISMDVVPFFYALSPNYGVPEEDYLIAYEQGRLSQAAKAIYESLLERGPQDAIALRRSCGMAGKRHAYGFDRGLVELQGAFMVLPTGVADAGGWHYAFVYDITARHFPHLPEAARPIHLQDASRRLAQLYLQSVGAVAVADIGRLFAWPPIDVDATVNSLVDAHLVRRGVRVPGQRGEWVAICDLVG